jgi:phospholipid/cholesterol/gamma-HCH transport system substrate-binding protein
MLTRFVRIQLIIFTIASVVGVVVMTFVYLQAPTLLGFGRLTVRLELPSGGGLYQFANVTYRGVQIGKVTDVDLNPTGAFATLSLNTSPKVPADLVAEVHSLSAVGEQYVDLLPRNSNPPYLQDGAIIPLQESTIPQPVGPMLDKVSALMGSIPKGRLSALIDESSKGLNDAGFDLGSLLDSSYTLTRDFHGASDQTKALIDDSVPFLDGAAESADATRIWARSIAGVTGQLVDDDPQIRSLLSKGPGAFDEVSTLLNQVKPTLPLLLANLTSLGKVAVTYHASLEQLLLLVPSFFRGISSTGPANNATGLPIGAFRIGLGDPVACTAGFLPPSQWRSPADTTTVDTPDGLYCKLPQDSPIMVRGIRNLPCMAHPGKRAPTVQICDSDKPFEPLALHEHTFGPYPIDPNLVAQGIPPDDRVPGEADGRLFAPTEGTPLPPGAVPSGAEPQAPPVPPPPLTPSPAPGDVPPEATPAAPASFSAAGADGPSVAVATYDPRTGRYVGPDGMAHVQSDLVTDSTARDWKDLVLKPDA